MPRCLGSLQNPCGLRSNSPRLQGKGPAGLETREQPKVLAQRSVQTPEGLLQLPLTFIGVCLLPLMRAGSLDSGTMTIMTAAQRRGWKDEDLARTEPVQTFPYVTHQSLAHSGVAPVSSPSSASNSKKINHPLHASVHQDSDILNYDPVWRPRSQQLLAEQPDDVPRPVRSRSRLQKRPSQRAMKSSHMSALQKKKSLDQKSLTALPQLQDSTAVPERSASLRTQQARHPAGTDRPKSAKDKLSGTGTILSTSGRSFRDSHTALPARPRTSPSVDNIKARAQTKPPPPPPSTAQVKSLPPGTNRLPRHVALAPYDPFPLNPIYHIPSPPLSNPESKPSLESKSQVQNEHSVMAEPQGRNRVDAPTENVTRQSIASVQTNSNNRSSIAGKSTTTPPQHQTDVTETLHPAVTQEVIHEHRVEIVQEEITREIHVHHYFTQVQPIRVLEVLPARHFLVDPDTGEKKEIPAPEGWSMPVNLQPRTPDTSILAPITRHYLVNEQHPLGILESSPPPHPPPTHPLPPAPGSARVPASSSSSSSRRPPSSFHNGASKSSDELRSLAAASHKAVWSPFPRSTSKASR